MEEFDPNAGAAANNAATLLKASTRATKETVLSSVALVLLELGVAWRASLLLVASGRRASTAAVMFGFDLVMHVCHPMPATLLFLPAVPCKAAGGVTNRSWQVQRGPSPC